MVSPTETQVVPWPIHSGSQLDSYAKRRSHMPGTKRLGPFAIHETDPFWRSPSRKQEMGWLFGIHQPKGAVRTPVAKKAPFQVPCDVSVVPLFLCGCQSATCCAVGLKHVPLAEGRPDKYTAIMLCTCRPNKYQKGTYKHQLRDSTRGWSRVLAGNSPRCNYSWTDENKNCGQIDG